MRHQNLPVVEQVAYRLAELGLRKDALAQSDRRMPRPAQGLVQSAAGERASRPCPSPPP